MKNSIQSKIKGALYGYAIGDAMGATTEFMSKDRIAAKYGVVKDIIGGGWLSLDAGEVTDDTQMTLCVCEAIERFPHDINKMLDRCCENFANWYASKPKDVGGCCASVISRCGNTNDHEHWLRVALNPDSLGNGSLMRTMPIVLSGLGSDAALLQGRLTHNNVTCDVFVEAYHSILTEILDGEAPFLCPQHLEPSGHVYNTYKNAIYWFAMSDTFEDAIINAVNDGGDADTIAAITGSLSGALYGYEAIPQKWIGQLDPKVTKQLDKYSKIFEKLYKKVCTNQ